MIERGPVTEDEMIVAFLQAEIDSSRYASEVTKGLAALGRERSLIDLPDLADSNQNWLRKQLLCYRGYERREGLFTRFLLDVAWRRVDLEACDFKTIRYIKDTVTEAPNWTNLSNGTRLVSDGAVNLRDHTSDPRFRQIVEIAGALRDGKRFAPLIAAQYNDDYLVIVEGHSRSTAYALEHLSGLVDAFVGSSPSMDKWPFY